jgi:hypothetical protein
MVGKEVIVFVWWLSQVHSQAYSFIIYKAMVLLMLFVLSRGRASGPHESFI